MGIHTYSVPAFTSQHLPYRNIEIFSFYIPECLLNSADGAAENRPASVKRSPVHNLPQVFNIKRILTKNRISQNMYRFLHYCTLSFQNRFSPAADSFICGDLHKQPPGLNVKGLQLCNFHFLSSCNLLVQYYGRCSHFYYSNIDFPRQSY